MLSHIQTDPRVPELAVTAARSQPGKYLAFTIGREEFAVPVNKVKEIIGLQEITAVPQTPSHVVGVINLRGRVVPVVDLRTRLGFEHRPFEDRTCIIVVQPCHGGREHQLGVVVDGVSEVVQIPAAEMEERESFSHGLIEAVYILGLAKARGKVRILLDIDTVLSPEELMAR